MNPNIMLKLQSFSSLITSTLSFRSSSFKSLNWILWIFSELHSFQWISDISYMFHSFTFTQNSELLQKIFSEYLRNHPELRLQHWNHALYLERKLIIVVIKIDDLMFINEALVNFVTLSQWLAEINWCIFTFRRTFVPN